mmetsp:Transcript_28003/g.45085  ORF Transcript_28003/g.45085 Transcript_28003/m.45085 type:complete len:159 (+) Transcript_28003:50-526(+)
MSSAAVRRAGLLMMMLSRSTNRMRVWGGGGSQHGAISSIHCIGRMNNAGASVSGTVWKGPPDSPVITLFTKEDCSLCDKVKDTLAALKDEYPHTLAAVDITDEEHQNWYNKYKFDIPVLHIEGKYFAKHRLTEEEAMKGLEEANTGCSEYRFQSLPDR